jgi:hypothetical protein
MNVHLAAALVLGMSVISPAAVCAQSTPSQQAPHVKPDPPDPQTPSPEQLGVSLERVRFALGQAAPPPLRINADTPTFKIQIVEKRRLFLPEFVEGLKIPWQPVPAGGRDNYDLMNMITPPEVRPYAAFNSTELAYVVPWSLASALLVDGLMQAGRYIRNESRARSAQEAKDEVLRSFVDFLHAHPEAPRPVWWNGEIR